MKKYSLSKISALWAAIFYILFAVVYPHVHIHAHETDTGKEISFIFHPPTPCPLTDHDNENHQECHFQTHPQALDIEFYRPSPKNLRDHFPTHEKQFNLFNILPAANGENEYTPLRYYSIESHSIPPPPGWYSSHTTRPPPSSF